MALLDIFSGNAFRVVTLTDAINVIPNMYGRTFELNIFTQKPIPTITFALEYKNGVLNLLQTSQRGGNGATLGIPKKNSIRDYRTVHIEHDDFITADEIQGVRKFGQEYQVEALSEIVAEKTADAAMKHDITLEHLQMGALKGVVLDADGSTLLDLFAEFGITQTVFTFPFSDPNADIGVFIESVKRFFEVNALGLMISNVYFLCSPEFMTSLTTHPSIRDAYKYYASTQEPARNDLRQRFVHKGVVFEEYVGQANALNADNSVTIRKFIPTGTAIPVPVAPGLFNTYFSPADFLAEVNKPGLKRYVKLLPDPSGKDKFVLLHTQQNPMPFCTQPRLLTKAVSG